MTKLSDVVYRDADAIDACLAKLAESRFLIIALDGRDGSGKTTLGHYLALGSGRQFLDTDLYLKQRPTSAPTHTKDLIKVLNRWKRRNRPIILAGIFIGTTLKSFGFSIELLVRLIRVDQSGNDEWAKSYVAYEDCFAPDHSVFLPCHGAEDPARACKMLEKMAAAGADGVDPCVRCETQSQIECRSNRRWWQ